MAADGLSAEPHPAPLFGRNEVTERVTELLQSAKTGRGRTLLLVGSGGIGKSTILRAAVRQAAELHFQVLQGRALPADVPEPFVLVQDLLRSAQRFEAEVNDGESREMLPLFLAPYEREPVDAGTAAPDSDGSGEWTEARRLLAHLGNPMSRGDAHRNQLFGTLVDFFVRLTRRGPTLLALDDVQFADESSLDFLVQLLSVVPDHPLAVLATVVPDDDAPGRSAAKLQTLRLAPGVWSEEIPPMTEPELRLFIRWMLNGREPGRDAVMRWFTQTEGNPLFVEHLVRAAMGFGAPASSAVFPAGHDLSELLLSRIQTLPETERRVLVYGSVLGKEFEFPLLARSAGGDEERLSESIDRLVHGGFLREKGGEVYEFVSERVRTDVYAGLTETRRRILHRKVGLALEASADPSTAAAYELARQFYLGREDEKAAEYNRRAADLATEAYANETAVIFLERAIECARRLPSLGAARELRLLIELGRIVDETGDYKRSEEVLLEAVARARASPESEAELALALLGLAQTRSDLTQYSSARELATEAFHVLTHLGNRRGLLAAHRVLGISSWRLGDFTEAERQQREELALAEVVGTPAEHGHALIDLANTYLQQGPERMDEALARYEQAAQIFAASEDHAARARVRMNRALLYHRLRRIPEATADLEEAIEAADLSRSPVWVGYTRLNMAQFRVEARDVPRAKAELERALVALAPLGDQLALQQAAMISGMVAQEAGELKSATHEYLRALEQARQLGLAPEVAEMQFRLAELARKKGDIAEARRLLNTAKDAGILSLRGDLAPNVESLTKELGGLP